MKGRFLIAAVIAAFAAAWSGAATAAPIAPLQMKAPPEIAALIAQHPGGTLEFHGTPLNGGGIENPNAFGYGQCWSQYARYNAGAGFSDLSYGLYMTPSWCAYVGYQLFSANTGANGPWINYGPVFVTYYRGPWVWTGCQSCTSIGYQEEAGYGFNGNGNSGGGVMDLAVQLYNNGQWWQYGWG